MHLSHSHKSHGHVWPAVGALIASMVVWLLLATAVVWLLLMTAAVLPTG